MQFAILPSVPIVQGQITMASPGLDPEAIGAYQSWMPNTFSLPLKFP